MLSGVTKNVQLSLSIITPNSDLAMQMLIWSLQQIQRSMTNFLRRVQNTSRICDVPAIFITSCTVALQPLKCVMFYYSSWCFSSRDPSQAQSLVAISFRGLFATVNCHGFRSGFFSTTAPTMAEPHQSDWFKIGRASCRERV